MLILVLVGQTFGDPELESIERQWRQKFESYVIRDHWAYDMVKDMVDRITDIAEYSYPIDVFIYDGKGAHATISAIYIGKDLIENLFDKRYPRIEDSLKVMFVIAHEAGHIILGHTRATARLNKLVGPGSGEMLAFNREQELEADKFAFLLLVRMGYSDYQVESAARAALSYMERVDGELTVRESQMSGHPTYAERHENIHRIAGMLVEMRRKFNITSDALSSGSLRDIDKYIAFYEKILDFMPRDINTLNNLSAAYILKARGEFDRVHRSVFEDRLFIALVPSYATSRYGTNEEVEEVEAMKRGFEYLKEAERYARHILKVDANNIYAFTNLGVIYRLRGEYEVDRDKAKTYLDSSYVFLRKAVDIYKNRDDADHITLASLYFNLGGSLYTAFVKNIKPADSPEKWFKKAISEADILGIPFYEAYVYLANIYESTGRKKLAEKIWRKLEGTIYYAKRNKSNMLVVSTSTYSPTEDRPNIGKISIGMDVKKVIKILGEPLYQDEGRLIYKWGVVYIGDNGRVSKIEITNGSTRYGIKTGMSLADVLQIYKERDGVTPKYIYTPHLGSIVLGIESSRGGYLRFYFEKTRRNGRIVQILKRIEWS